jgi:hypothetical protein
MIDYSLLNAENIVYKVRMKTSSTISKIRQKLRKDLASRQDF